MQTLTEKLKAAIIAESYEDRAGRSVISVKSALDIVDRLAVIDNVEKFGTCWPDERLAAEQEELKDSGWIPCSERLPEVQLTYDIFKRPDKWISDSVLVTVKSVHANNETHYYVSTDLRIGSRLEDVHWLMSCGIGGSAILHQEIIAWQPLPEAYKPKKQRKNNELGT